MLRAKLLKLHKDNSGSSLMIALAIMAVLIALALALLLVSYSLFASTNQNWLAERNREMANTLSLSLRKDIETVVTEDSVNNVEQLNKVCPVWKYLYDNMWSTTKKWAYYNPEEYGHGVAQAYRYFNLSADKSSITSPNMSIADADGNMKDLEIVLYYMPPEGWDGTEHSGTTLVVEVRMGPEGDRSRCVVTTKYSLTEEEKTVAGKKIRVWNWVFNECY